MSKVVASAAIPAKPGKRVVCSITDHETRTTAGWVKNSRTTYYTVISVTLGTESPERGKVERRYKEFNSLYNALVSKYGAARIPTFLCSTYKMVEDHFSKAFCDARALLLADWLNRTINHDDDLLNEDLLIEFLQLVPSTAYDEGLGNLSTTASYGTTRNQQVTKIFSVASEEKVRMTEEDKQYLPQGEVMQVYRITDDDL